MKFTLAEIRWMQRGLNAIFETALPIKLSYQLSKLFNLFNKEMIEVEKARVDLVKKLSNGIEDSSGEIRVPPESEDRFRQEFAQLLQSEIEVDFTPIKLSDFGDDIKISPAELSSLYKIIKED